MAQGWGCVHAGVCVCVCGEGGGGGGEEGGGGIGHQSQARLISRYQEHAWSLYHNASN